MIIEAVVIIGAILVGWTLRGYRIGQVQEIKKQLKRKLFGNKSGVVDWTPPKDDETIASEKVMEDLKLK